MGKIHAFDEDDARIYGLHAAILLSHIRQEISMNQARKEYSHDEKVWARISVKQLAKFYKFFTEKQVRYILDGLVAAGVLVRGNFNATKFDRTLWYTYGPRHT